MTGEWPVKTIAECASTEPYSTQIGPFGKALMADEYTASGVPVLRGVNVNRGRFHDDDFVFIDENTADRLCKFESYPGDVLLVHKGTLGQIGLMPSRRKYARYIMGNSMMRVRCDPAKLLPEYLYHWLSSADGQHYLFSRVSQVGVPQIQTPLSTLRQATLPVPPLPEQRAIAHILGTLDDKIELNRRMNETLEAMARALFKSWFVDFLPVRAKMAAKENDPSLLLPEVQPDTWYVYAIECNDGSLYIGQTEDLRQRWLQHVSGRGADWTKHHLPVRVPFWERQPSREAAIEREQWLKTGFGRKWLKTQIAASARTQTGDPLPASAGQAGVRVKAEGRDPGLPQPLADLFPDSFEDSELGEIPKGWEVKTLGELLELTYGKALKAESRQHGTVPVYGSNGQVGLHHEKLVTGPGIIVGRKGNPGIVKWVSTDFFPIDTTFYVVPTDRCRSLHFLFYALKLQDLASLGADSAVPGLNRNLAYMSKQIVPSGPDQVFDAFDSFVQPLFERIYEAEDESRILAALRDTLLPKLISGELRVKNVEPKPS